MEISAPDPRFTGSALSYFSAARRTASAASSTYRNSRVAFPVPQAEKYDKADPVNLGSGAEISIRDLLQKICLLSGYSGEIRWDSAQPDGQPRRCLDTSRALAEFGWRANTPLDQGLPKTVDWYLQNRSGLKAHSSI